MTPPWRTAYSFAALARAVSLARFSLMQELEVPTMLGHPEPVLRKYLSRLADTLPSSKDLKPCLRRFFSAALACFTASWTSFLEGLLLESFPQQGASSISAAARRVVSFFILSCSWFIIIYEPVARNFHVKKKYDERITRVRSIW
jgi:hypothetical protein